MKISTVEFPEKLLPYRGVIGFVVVLIISNLFWKYNVLGDDSNTAVTLWNYDISAPFTVVTRHVAETTAGILNTLGWSINLNTNNVVRHETGNAAQIIWSCSGIKQAYIFFCIMAFSRGSWIKKIWYIPLGLVVVYIFNIFRITAIVAIINHHPNWFDFFHLYLFKYTFYLIIFGMWVLWEEKTSKIRKT